MMMILVSLLSESLKTDIRKDFLAFVVFPMMVFPIIGSMGQIGSLHHKELLLTFPLNNFLFASIRPLLLSLIYSFFFVGALKMTNGYSGEEISMAFAASVFYMNLAGFFLVYFKNVALGIILPLAYLFFGIFTTGTGQGFFYLMQWNRANSALSISDCMATQLVATGIFNLGALYFLKKRNKYHWGL